MRSLLSEAGTSAGLVVTSFCLFFKLYKNKKDFDSKLGFELDLNEMTLNRKYDSTFSFKLICIKLTKSLVSGC